MLQGKAHKLRIFEWISLDLNDRIFSVRANPEALAEASKLDHGLKDNIHNPGNIADTH
jgi:hypothetical protein